jgi:glycosyltransferase involved in cell wall biosynthesis
MGSEPGMAWNWCVNLANYCELHIITEGEFKDKIEAELPTLPQKKNMHFYYNPVSDKIRKMCWNQGDWRFYYYYKQWQYKTYQIVLDIIQKEKIDIIHQLNMIGFREPGYLWKIEDIPFVWGPIGGMFHVPYKYLEEATLKRKIILLSKYFINKIQVKYSSRVCKAISISSRLISSTPNEVSQIQKIHGKCSILESETGCIFNPNIINSYKNDGDFNIVWVGRFIFSKQLSIALKSIAKNKELKNIKFHIIGKGNDKETIFYKKLCSDLQLEDIATWHGQVSNSDVFDIMKKSQLFFFTSVAEATSTVVLEALSCNLPVLCFDTCGFGYIVNESVGLKIKLSNPNQSVIDFAKQIEYLYHHREVLQQMSQNCMQRQQELSWENKAKQMVELYKQAIKSTEKQHL